MLNIRQRTWLDFKILEVFFKLNHSMILLSALDDTRKKQFALFLPKLAFGGWLGARCLLVLLLSLQHQ